MPRVHLPRSLLAFWSGAPVVEVRGATLADALRELDAKWPGLSARVLDDQGRVRRYVNVFVNRDLVVARAPRDVALGEGDEVHILPSVAGG